jgi:hypothetical protein
MEIPGKSMVAGGEQGCRARSQPIVCKKVIRMASAVAIAILLAGLPRATAQAANEVAVAQVNAKSVPAVRIHLAPAYSLRNSIGFAQSHTRSHFQAALSVWESLRSGQPKKWLFKTECRLRQSQATHTDKARTALHDTLSIRAIYWILLPKPPPAISSKPSARVMLVPLHFPGRNSEMPQCCTRAQFHRDEHRLSDLLFGGSSLLSLACMIGYA